MGDLEVHLPELTRLATALDRIAHGLEAARGELRGADSLGDEQVVDGVEHLLRTAGSAVVRRTGRTPRRCP